MKFVIGMKYGNFAHTHPRTAFSMYCRPSMKVKVAKRDTPLKSKYQSNEKPSLWSISTYFKWCV